jgi:hypothetical protein
VDDLVGHKSTVVTELVYRKQIRPVVQSGADVMDRIFGPAKEVRRMLSHAFSHAPRGTMTNQMAGRACDLRFPK